MRNKFDLTTINNTITNPHASRLQTLVQEKLTDDRLGTVVDKLLDKADKGDTKALDYLLTIGGFRQAAPQTVVVQQFYEAPQSPAAEPRRIVEAPTMSLSQRIIGYLGVAGVAKAAVIAEQLQIREAEIVRVLDDRPELFGVDEQGYFVIGQVKGKGKHR